MKTVKLKNIHDRMEIVTPHKYIFHDGMEIVTNPKINDWMFHGGIKIFISQKSIFMMECKLLHPKKSMFHDGMAIITPKKIPCFPREWKLLHFKNIWICLGKS